MGGGAGIPRELYRRCAELGFLGLKFPEAYGGQGGDHLHDAVWARSWPGRAARPYAAHVIYLLRHGEAEVGNGDDAARRLTEKGARQARGAGIALKELGAGIEACLSSPKVRADETGRLACAALGIEVEVTEALRGGPFDALDLAAGRGEVLLVGHEPDFSAEVGRLTGADIDLKKGGIAVVDGSTLVALLRPKELKRIAR